MNKEYIEKIRSMLNRVLLSEDPYISVRNDGDEENLYWLFNNVMSYIEASLDIGANPLQHLRKYFDGFKWQFVDPQTIEELVATLEDADYAWPRYDGDDWSGGMFVAQQIGRPSSRRRKICYGIGDHKIWGHELAIEHGAKFIVKDEDHEHGEHKIV